MIRLTVAGMVTEGASGTREESKVCSAILADIDMRGFAISSLILAGIASLGFLFAL
jgi:hypothetical protein